MQHEDNVVSRAQQGDRDALAKLYEEYFTRIYRYILVRVRDRGDAEDLTQQVFLKVLASISSYNERGKPVSAWIFTIAHNQVVDFSRKRARDKRSITREALLDAGGDPRLDPALMAEQGLQMEQLMAAIATLSSGQREVVLLRFISGLSIAETAEALGKSEGAVKTLQHTGLAALRKRLLPQGVDKGNER